MSYERPQSPLDGVHWVEDFISNDSVADAAIGQQRWELVTIGNASTITNLTATDGGAIHIVTAATATGDGEVLRSFTDGLVINGGAGGFSFRAKLVDQIASNNFRIGLDDSVTATSPTVGIWVDCDGGVISLQVDSADGGDLSIAASGVSTLTSGTTMVVATWHTFRVEWSGSNSVGGPRFVELFIDGEAAGSSLCLIDDDEEVEIKIAHWQDSGGALAVELDLDFFEFWQWIDRE
uniref:Uncharacterized protein n=1 Tax=viral metagenome TaxID=1070528 RepID=A0A6M3XW04_9ZZZZ